MSVEDVQNWLGHGFLDAVEEWLPEAVQALFSSEWLFGNGLFYNLGIHIWNWALSIIGLTASTTPQNFSGEAWTYITTTVLDFSMGVAATLLNIFYMVGIIRLSTNLKEAFTLEVWTDNMIKMLLGNMLILNGKDLIVILFDIASISADAFLLEVGTFRQDDVDTGSIMFNWIFGWMFMTVSIACAFMIFMTLYSRYLGLYMLVAVYPFAFCTLPAGRGVNNTAGAWTRTFISKTFEIVVIAIAVSIASKMCNQIDFGSGAAGYQEVDGVLQTLQSMATMIVLTVAVKTTDSFMRRAFGL